MSFTTDSLSGLAFASFGGISARVTALLRGRHEQTSAFFQAEVANFDSVDFVRHLNDLETVLCCATHNLDTPKSFNRRLDRLCKWFRRISSICILPPIT